LQAFIYLFFGMRKRRPDKGQCVRGSHEPLLLCNVKTAIADVLPTPNPHQPLGYREYRLRRLGRSVADDLQRQSNRFRISLSALAMSRREPEPLTMKPTASFSATFYNRRAVSRAMTITPTSIKACSKSRITNWSRRGSNP